VNGENSTQKNIKEVLENIKKAALKSGRNPEEIKLIAVTKNFDITRVNEAIDAGIIDLGENRVQELIGKYDNTNKVCNWHLIGHLQTNKVKYIIDKVSMIHSLDSMELAEEIQKRAQKAGKIMDVLIEVNVAQEESKFGITLNDTEPFIRKLSAFPNVSVKGLMTVAPYADNPETIRYVFKNLYKKFIDIKKENIDNIDMAFLSMGMSNDYEIAIEEGANIVRVGTAIFGKRVYAQEK
jgi:pyridoxal phosphate enzyme (YggS family)